MQPKILYILFILFFISETAFTQPKPVETDSLQLYKNIERYSKRNKFNKLVYSLLFKPAAPRPPKKKPYKKLLVKKYAAFEGKVIRSINIETLDPFGFSISDTSIKPRNFLVKAGNNLHVKSQNITIRNLLIIQKNQLFDSLLVKESERLIRSSIYVRDVSFTIKATSKNSDSVDIYIREIDNWSIIPDGAVSASSITFRLKDRNFLGAGHESQIGMTNYPASGDNAYNLKYYIPNYRNTYINSTLIYGADEFKNFTKSVAVDRPFFSPFAKWAAGVKFSQEFRQDSVRNSNSQLFLQRVKFNSQDFWAGSAIQLFKGNTEYSRTTNFISTIRFLRIRYLEKPIEMNDIPHIFTNENLYLVSFGISTRKYVQDKYIFKFGITEDIPIGKVYSITGGYQVKNNADRLYLGARVSFGNYYSWGYLSSNFEYGTFIRASNAQQGVTSVSIKYFTGLIEIENWKLRQFIEPQLTLGINRFPSDSLSLNEEYGTGIDGFNSNVISGTSRLLLSFQTQAYAPWNILGFRFGPFMTFSLGTLGNSITGLTRGKLYSQIGFGILIKNENLVINPFQISIAFYPNIPGIGQNIIKTNSFRSTDFGFREYEIGKPEIFVFQ